MDDRLSTKKALEVLGWTHRNTLYTRVKAGEIAVIKDGQRSYYLRSELERYLNAVQNPEITVEEAHRRAQEAADYADRGLEWPPKS
ncbi:helix-turn-helix domain-containing protein [Mesorhizobium sp. CN2-181]|uniref:helix-turn-helix domain-containing protein n=1 Tax=Mesorhizobium yinganensis TaxID=3157707 RepID=UPI0032B73F41